LISVVVPVFRSAATLHDLLERLRKSLRDDAFEVVFVDDHSPDESATIIAGLARTDSRIRLVQHDGNHGQNSAVLSGFDASRGDVIAVIDADLQDPPEALPDLLRHKNETGSEVVFAARRGEYAGLLRMITSRLYKRLLCRITGLPEGAGLFMVLDRDVAKRVLAMAPMPSVVAAVGVLRVTATSLPVARACRREGASSYSFFNRLSLAARTLRWVAAHR
jgi:polyisoprenyl-phosphate glycosyltransferase